MNELNSIIRRVAIVAIVVPSMLFAWQESPATQEHVATPGISKSQMEESVEAEFVDGTVGDPEINATESAESANRVVHDMSKSFIELPIEGLIALAPQPVNAFDENPICEPGKVTWHADFATACAASQESGKPVLLFQLLGELDHRFT